MKVSAVIPARYASSRLPGKPLADILGKPMIQRVYEQTQQARLVDEVIVATDDARVADAVNAFGGRVVMTRVDHPTGTDRLAEVVAGMDADLIVNVQGDEPLIAPEVIDAAVQPLKADPELMMGTLKSRLHSRREFMDPNVVKVVTDNVGNALYFSRAPIPWPRDTVDTLPEDLHGCCAYRHIGLYVYRRAFLLRYAAMAEGALEQLEKLEQLRVLEAGVNIRVVETGHDAIGVDTPDDLQRVIDYLQNATV